MKNEFKEGQELEFNIYGSKLVGKYISMLNDEIVRVKVLSSAELVHDLGGIASVNVAFLVNN